MAKEKKRGGGRRGYLWIGGVWCWCVILNTAGLWKIRYGGGWIGHSALLWSARLGLGEGEGGDGFGLLWVWRTVSWGYGVRLPESLQGVLAVGLRFGVSGGMDAMCRLGLSGPLHEVLIVS